MRMDNIQIPGLAEIPFVGRLLFAQDPLFYVSIALVVGTSWFLFRTRAGLTLRSVGDSATSAHALGINVIRIRYLAVIWGGACAGLAGAYLPLVYTPQWVENMTAGRGWIALALVVFASWRPWRTLAGAWLFGAITILQLHIQAMSLNELEFLPGWLYWLASLLKSIPSQFLSALPYLATPVTRLVAPGPDVVKQTPGFLEILAYPWAACTAPCSCLTMTCFNLSSKLNNASYIGMVAPPM